MEVCAPIFQSQLWSSETLHIKEQTYTKEKMLGLESTKEYTNQRPNYGGCEKAEEEEARFSHIKTKTYVCKAT